MKNKVLILTVLSVIIVTNVFSPALYAEELPKGDYTVIPKTRGAIVTGDWFTDYIRSYDGHAKVSTKNVDNEKITGELRILEEGGKIKTSQGYTLNPGQSVSASYNYTNFNLEYKGCVFVDDNNHFTHSPRYDA